MRFFHVLLAVAGTLRSIWALVELTLVQGGLGRVSVVHVTITFFLGGPTFGVVIAVRILTLPGASVCLLVFPMDGLAFQFCYFDSMNRSTYVKSQGRLKTLSQSAHF